MTLWIYIQRFESLRTFRHPVAVVEPVMIDGRRQNRKAATPQNTRRCLVIVVESCAVCLCQAIVFATWQTSCVLMPNVGAVVVTKIFLGSCPFTCEAMHNGASNEIKEIKVCKKCPKVEPYCALIFDPIMFKPFLDDAYLPNFFAKCF